MTDYNKIDNPYTLQFSYIPPKFIERTIITTEIIENYIRPVPTYRGIFITGVRGAGKTVILGDIRNKIGAMKNWITIDLNPESNLLNSLAGSLYLMPEIRALFVNAKLDFSLLGIGVHIENAELIAATEEDALRMMLEVLKAEGIKLLVTIDEVTYSKDVARFSHALSSYASFDYDIYVLMTGLTDNIKNIRNKKSLTFLYRAKMQELDMLNIPAICLDYQKTLGISRDEAEGLAYKTRGYSLAFQALGFHFWNALCDCNEYKEIDEEKIDNELDATLSELAYDKIWAELSVKDIAVLEAMIKIKNNDGNDLIKIEKIREETNMSSDVFTKYRERLLDSGIVDGQQYGYLKFKLPRFEEYIVNRQMLF